ncbi:MAG: endonuclease domain-containing protein [Flavobacteriales bacterium]|nr:endonuclease domain-containing protein [Flavobacteriales bacterium]MBL4734982.1 endonuclease domain-containing protein [Flavobacteriales bacterium]
MTKPNRETLKSYAREMRNNSTKGEIRLWCELLRSRSMHGYQFLRQYAIDYYIADFACRRLRLIIEVDGYYHNNRQEEDQRRTEYLNTLGYTVLRFTEEEVKDQIKSVGRVIEDYIEEFENEAVQENSVNHCTSPGPVGPPPSKDGGPSRNYSGT